MTDFFRSAWRYRSGRLALISSAVSLALLSVSIALVAAHKWPMAVVAGVLGFGEAAEVVLVWCPSWERQINRDQRMS